MPPEFRRLSAELERLSRLAQNDMRLLSEEMKQRMDELVARASGNVTAPVHEAFEKLAASYDERLQARLGELQAEMEALFPPHYLPPPKRGRPDLDRMVRWTPPRKGRRKPPGSSRRWRSAGDAGPARRSVRWCRGTP